ncbi:MAG TPA: hypothetical protein VJN95_13105 [Gemmatimonadales bacterium]|nr:hypothetical protein [Gemmatimonadales bacterium]
MICERCGEHEADIRVSRVDRDRVLSLDLCAGCGRLGIEEAWPLKEEPEEMERPGREVPRYRAGAMAQREFRGDD